MTISMDPGLSSRPPELPAAAKKRFGHVGPGIDENQRSQTANSRASVVSTGSCSGSKHLMTLFGSSAPRCRCVAMKPLMSIAG